jgi:formate dehydrogenase subunit gamma
VLTHERTGAICAEKHLPAEILRFKTTERHLHWAIAAPFMVCYATALVLLAVYNPDPTRPFRAVFSWAHRLSGVCLFVLPLWTVVRHRRDFDVHFHNVRTAWRWRVEDLKWLFLMGLSTIDKRVVLPDQGKFNAGEKLNFMFLTASYPLYIITGFLIWMPGVAFASWMVHISLAALATPLIFGHVFMATVNPDTRVGLSGMISGYVDRRWALHHYRHWYNEHFWHLHAAADASAEATTARRVDTQPKPEQTVTVKTLTDAPKPGADNDLSAGTGPQVGRRAPKTATEAAKPITNKDFSTGSWPQSLRPAPARQSSPETI